jgi:tetratricopeptide (TPR) repeat protein
MKKREADTYLTLGLKCLHDDDCNRAISLLSIAIDLDSHFAEAYGFRGFAYFTLGMHREAMDDYNIALSLDPSLHNVYYFRATLHLMLKNYQDAIDDFTLAIELDNYLAEAYFYRGICKGMLDDEKGGTYDIKAAASLGMPEAQKKLNEKGIVW